MSTDSQDQMLSVIMHLLVNIITTLRGPQNMACVKDCRYMQHLSLGAAI